MVCFCMRFWRMTVGGNRKTRRRRVSDTRNSTGKPHRRPIEDVEPLRAQKGTVVLSHCAHALQSLATLRGTWGTESWFEETHPPSETLNPCSRQRKTHSKDNRALTMQSLATLRGSESRNEFSKKQRRYCVAVPSLLFGDPSETRTPDPLIKSQVLYRLS